MNLNRTLAALLTAGAMALPAQAVLAASDLSAAPAVKSVDVDVDLSAIGNSEALAYWQTLETDLETAIMAKVENKDPAAGTDVNVTIDALRLAEGFSPATGIATAWLAGKVDQNDPDNKGRDAHFELAVDMKSSLPEGTDTSEHMPDNPVIYQAMVDAFARSVVEGLN